MSSAAPKRPGASQARHPPTLRDVAALAEVDPSVVSRVLRNDPRLTISPQTRQRVLAASERLNYQPNIQARGFRLRRTWTIGFVLPDIGNPVYAQILQGAQSRAEDTGYALAVGSPLDGQSVDLTFARLLEERRFDGLLVASGLVEDSRMRALATGHAPVVVVNRRVRGVESSIIVDDVAGADLATTHLVELGHRSVAHIGGPRDVDTSIRRSEGFVAAVNRVGIDNYVIVPADGYPVQAGYEAAQQIFRGAEKVTGIFAANVMLALGTIRAARAQGRRVPDDLSVVALHDFPLAEFIEPPLTTVAMPLRELGAEAVDMLLARIDGAAGEGKMVTIPPRLVIRASSAPPR
jgi:LacI family transcriptional regulator